MVLALDDFMIHSVPKHDQDLLNLYHLASDSSPWHPRY